MHAKNKPYKGQFSQLQQQLLSLLKLLSHITRTRAIDRQIQEDYGYIMRVYKGTSKCKSKRLFETQNSTKNWKNYAKVYIREIGMKMSVVVGNLSRDSGVTRRG